MFLLQRKSDGKFYTNKDYHSGVSWSSHPGDCRPFRSIQGLKSSRGVVLGRLVPIPEKMRPILDALPREPVWYNKSLFTKQATIQFGDRTYDYNYYGHSKPPSERLWERWGFDELYFVVPVSVEVVK